MTDETNSAAAAAQDPLTTALTPAPKKSRRGIIIGAVIAVVVIIVVVLALALPHGSNNGKPNTTSSPSTSVSASPTSAPLTTTKSKTEAQKALISDVEKTTAKLKTYLKSHPNASAGDLLKQGSVKSVVGDQVVISGNYKLWYVIGTNLKVFPLEKKKPQTQYLYQSYSNTFRGAGNLSKLPIVEDKAPRNANAIGGK